MTQIKPDEQAFLICQLSASLTVEERPWEGQTLWRWNDKTETVVSWKELMVFFLMERRLDGV